MPHETIDLLSSSPEPTKASHKSQSKSAFKQPSTIEPLPTRVPSPKHIIEILSDDDKPQGRTLPSSSARVAHVGTSLSSHHDLPPSSSDDDLPTLPSLSTSSRGRTNLPAKSLKRDRDFYYLSEDFDSTIDLDKSVSDARSLPASKILAVASQDDVDTKAPARSAMYNMSHPDHETSTRYQRIPKLRKASTVGGGSLIEADPIIFTSSPDPYHDAAKKRAAGKVSASRRIGLASNPLPGLSSDEVFPSDVDEIPVTKKAKSRGSPTQFEKFLADREKEKQKAAKKSQKELKSSFTNEETQKKLAEKEAEKERRQALKEEKEREKKEKAKEKEKATELAKVNTLRTNKNVSSTEMIIEIPTCLDMKLRVQAEAHLEGSKITHQRWESQMPIIKFRRKIDAEYNESLDQYEPVKRYIKKENVIIYIMKAREFVEFVTNDEENNIDVFVLQLKAKFEGYQIIMLVEGYLTFIRKNRNIKVRQFTNNVRAIGAEVDEVPSNTQRRKKKEVEYIDEELLEDAMLRLQMIHELLVHHTAVVGETAEQITIFTQHISTIPYKAQRNHSTFCMESGQVKTGDGPTDTYVKMLQEIVRITAPIAYGIQSKYPTVRSLIEGCLEEGPKVVEECRKSANKDGAFTDRKIGPAVSKRVWRVFTGRDVNSLDV